MDTFAIALPILIPLGTAIVLPIVELAGRSIRIIFSLLASALTVASLLRLLPSISGGETLVYWMSGWAPRDGLGIGISLVVDGWGFLVALIVSIVGFMCLFYSVVYMRHETGRSSFYVLFMLLIAALIGFALSGDLFNQFVWLEVFSVAAFALTGFHYEERTSVEAAFKYLITNSIASLFIAVALSLIYMQTGALNLAHIAREFQPTTSGVVAVGLLIGGYATKAALVPWHFWLPDAHTVAPAPVSAMFSGALIKIGIYAIARSIFTLAPSLLGSRLQFPLLAIAALSMFVGGFQMLQQQSIKRVLAFSSVSQMGYALMGLAIGSPVGLAAAAMHLIHHAMVKSALFMAAGMIAWRTDIHMLREAGGLARKLPYSFVIFCLAGLSLSGIPLFSGFIGKTMLEEAAVQGGTSLMSYLAVFASLLTFAGMARLVWALFLAPPAVPDRPNLREAPVLALVPMIILVLGSLWVGLFPQWAAANLAWPAAESLLSSERYTTSVMNLTESHALEKLEVHREPVPQALDWHHWLAPAVIMVGGSLLAYFTLKRRQFEDKMWAIPLEEISHVLRRWHSGVVNDYALWTALGTAVILLVFVLSSRVF